MAVDEQPGGADPRLAAVLEELREKDAFNFALFQHNPLAITVVDRAGCVVKSNLARRRAADPLPPLGQPLFRSGDGHQPDMRAPLAAAIASGAPRECPEVAHGRRLYAYTLAPFAHGAIVLRRDITEQKQAQDQLIQAQKLAALGTLVSGVAHEVSNPNNVILLSARSLSRLFEEILPVLDAHAAAHPDFELGMTPYAEIRGELAELTASCRRGAERIQQLVNDLKGYARRDDGDMSRRFDLNDVARGAAGLLGATLRKATTRFTLELAADPLPVAGVDRRIEQVVINLLGNACDALPDPARGITLRTVLDRAAGCARLEVHDEGAGIPADVLPQVTDPFFTTKHDSGGTGLGLSISRQIVENHRGSLVLRSRAGAGTTATITLPLAAGETAPPGE